MTCLYFLSTSLLSGIRCPTLILDLPCFLPLPLRDSWVFIFVIQSQNCRKPHLPYLFTHQPQSSLAEAHHHHHYHPRENSGLTHLLCKVKVSQSLLLPRTPPSHPGSFQVLFPLYPRQPPWADLIVPLSVFPQHFLHILIMMVILYYCALVTFLARLNSNIFKQPGEKGTNFSLF